MDGAQMLMLAYDEFRLNKDLQHCTVDSFLGAILQSSKLGLYISSALGKAYIAPFNNKRNGTKECKFIIGYRGMIELAGRAPKIKKVEAHCVYKQDLFEFEYGTNEHLKHKIYPFGTKLYEEDEHGNMVPITEPQGDKDIIAAYAMATFDKDTRNFEVMKRSDILRIKARSPASHRTDMPWHTDFPAMARKTPLRKLFKFLPYSTEEMQAAVTIDELADSGKQDLAKIYELEMGGNGFLPSPQTITNAQPKQPIQTQVNNLTEMLKKNGMGAKKEVPIEVQV